MENNCGNCKYEPEWEPRPWGNSKGVCKHPTVKKVLAKKSPFCVDATIIEKYKGNNGFSYGGDGCPAWKPKEQQ